MAQFQSGQPRPKNAGIKKGTKHKSTEIRDFVKCEPIEKVIDLLEHGDIKDADRAKIWIEICKYFYKKPEGEVDVNISSGLEIKVITNRES